MSTKYRRRISDNPPCNINIVVTPVMPIKATVNAIRNKVRLAGVEVPLLVATITGRDFIVMCLRIKRNKIK